MRSKQKHPVSHDSAKTTRWLLCLKWIVGTLTTVVGALMITITTNFSNLPPPGASYTSELEAVRASEPMLSLVALLQHTQWNTRNTGRQTNRHTHMYNISNFFGRGAG